MNLQTKSFTDRIDWILVLFFIFFCTIGFLSIYSIEHRAEDITFFMMKKRYMKQLIWFGISIIVAVVLILIDSKFITSSSYLSYAIGLVLLLLVFTPLGKGTKGSHSWINLGFFSFQPGEIMKLFASLSISKFLSSQETDFSTLKHRLLCTGFAVVPFLLMLLQNETGLALVYFSLFLAMYREGLPNIVLIAGFSLIILTILTLVIDKNILFLLLTAFALFIIFIERKNLQKNRQNLFIIIFIWGFGILFSQLLIPFTFKHVLKPYHVQRIYTMLGQDVPAEYIKENTIKIKQSASNYNVNQSKIAIASGGFLGKGFLNGTQTQFDWVPEQQTDFIFCTIGEQFGFVGSTILILMYVFMLLRIVFIAERQRSKFSRVYAYCVAGILFFHLVINIGMTIGLAPVIGIPLPYISYGGTSLLTFTILLFVLIRLDADRQMVLR